MSKGNRKFTKEKSQLLKTLLAQAQRKGYIQADTIKSRFARYNHVGVRPLVVASRRNKHCAVALGCIDLEQILISDNCICDLFPVRQCHHCHHTVTQFDWQNRALRPCQLCIARLDTACGHICVWVIPRRLYPILFRRICRQCQNPRQTNRK